MKTIKIKTINKRDFQRLNRIHKESGVSNFWIIGSTTYRKIAMDMGFYFKHNDYDMAIIGGFKKNNNILKILKENGFFITKDRIYYVKFNKAYQIMAKKGKFLLDIVIVKNISHLGHFNWESIFWHFPSGLIYDPFDALDALRKKELIPTISAAEENPFILASRFAKLCARFDVDFYKDKRLFNFAKNISERVNKWNSKNFFHGIYAKEHSYFNTLQSILIAKKRRRFILDLQKTKLLQAMFPEINKYVPFKPGVIKKIEKAKNVKDIVLAIEFSIGEFPGMFKKIKKRFEIISDRLEEDNIKNKRI